MQLKHVFQSWYIYIWQRGRLKCKTLSYALHLGWTDLTGLNPLAVLLDLRLLLSGPLLSSLSCQFSPLFSELCLLSDSLWSGSLWGTKHHLVPTSVGVEGAECLAGLVSLSFLLLSFRLPLCYQCLLNSSSGNLSDTAIVISPHYSWLLRLMLLLMC